MLILGLTGGVACGKSAVARLFEHLGAKVVDADEIAHELMEPGTVIWKKIIDSFGQGILDKDKCIDRVKLGDLIFKDEEKREKLEEIIHPLIIETIKEKLQEFSTLEPQPSMVIIDVPLLIEADLTNLTDKLLVISARRQVQVSRLEGRGFTVEEANRRIDAQMPLEEKVKLADYVIRNNGSLEEVEKQVKEIWKDIR